MFWPCIFSQGRIYVQFERLLNFLNLRSVYTESLLLPKRNLHSACAVLVFFSTGSRTSCAVSSLFRGGNDAPFQQGFCLLPKAGITQFMRFLVLFNAEFAHFIRCPVCFQRGDGIKTVIGGITSLFFIEKGAIVNHSLLAGGFLQCMLFFHSFFHFRYDPVFHDEHIDK